MLSTPNICMCSIQHHQEPLLCRAMRLCRRQGLCVSAQLTHLPRQELPHDDAKAVDVRLGRQLRLRQKLRRHVWHSLQKPDSMTSVKAPSSMQVSVTGTVTYTHAKQGTQVRQRSAYPTDSSLQELNISCEWDQDSPLESLGCRCRVMGLPRRSAWIHG